MHSVPLVQLLLKGYLVLVFYLNLIYLFKFLIDVCVSDCNSGEYVDSNNKC